MDLSGVSTDDLLAYREGRLQDVSTEGLLAFRDIKKPVAKTASKSSQATEPSYTQRIGNIFSDRMNQIGEIKTRTALQEQTYPETVLQATGTVTGGAMDVIGETAMTGLSAITPDFVKSGLKNTAQSVLSTDIGRAGLSAAKEGIDTYNAWAAENPRIAKDLESVVNIGLTLVPAKGKKAPSKSTMIGDIGEASVKSGSKSRIAARSEFIDDLVLPLGTPSVKAEQALRTTERGALLKQTYNLSPLERDVAETVKSIAKVTPNRSYQYNLNKLQEAAGKEARYLENKLSGLKITFPKQEYKAQIDNAVTRLANNPILVGDAEKTAERLVGEFYKIVDNVPPTPAGLLQARKNFDAVVRRYKPNAFDPKAENAFTEVVRELRTTTNQFIADKSPSVAVKNSLKKQSNLLYAVDNIAAKAGKESSTVIGRLAQKVGRVVPLKTEIAGLAALGGLGASGIISPATAGLAAGGVGAYKLAKAPISREILGQLLIATDKAIRVARDKDLIRNLMADRALVKEIMNNLTEQQEQPNEPDSK
jgi:hypothetical protein